MVECAHSPIDRCAVQSFRELQNGSHGVFRHRQGIA
jgi:hypothetical protein